MNVGIMVVRRKRHVVAVVPPQSTPQSVKVRLGIDQSLSFRLGHARQQRSDVYNVVYVVLAPEKLDKAQRVLSLHEQVHRRVGVHVPAIADDPKTDGGLGALSVNVSLATTVCAHDGVVLEKKRR